jgi:hypothetical protein
MKIAALTLALLAASPTPAEQIELRKGLVRGMAYLAAHDALNARRAFARPAQARVAEADVGMGCTYDIRCLRDHNGDPSLADATMADAWYAAAEEDKAAAASRGTKFAQ